LCVPAAPARAGSAARGRDILPHRPAVAAERQTGEVMRRSARHVLGSLLVLMGALQGCSGKSRQVAEAATLELRERYSRSEFDQIYAASAPELWTRSTHDDFVKVMQGVTRKLGDYRSATETGWRVFRGTSGTMVTLGYNTAFERGIADEVFDWKIESHTAKLAGYHINSNAFLAE